jgi:hypothetical protein
MVYNIKLKWTRQELYRLRGSGLRQWLLGSYISEVKTANSRNSEIWTKYEVNLENPQAKPNTHIYYIFYM